MGSPPFGIDDIFLRERLTALAGSNVFAAVDFVIECRPGVRIAVPAAAVLVMAVLMIMMMPVLLLLPPPPPPPPTPPLLLLLLLRL